MYCRFEVNCVNAALVSCVPSTRTTEEVFEVLLSFCGMMMMAIATATLHCSLRSLNHGKIQKYLPLQYSNRSMREF